MRLNGPLTAAAGTLLLVLTALHVRHLRLIPVHLQLESARSELRGLSAAIRWRLERDLALQDQNAPSMKRALRGAVTDSPSLEWAALHATSGKRLAAAGPAPDLPASLFAGAGGRSDGQPEVFETDGGRVRGLARIWIAEREMVLAVGFLRPASPLADRVRALSLGTLAAGVTAALLLMVKGLGEIAAARRTR